MKKLICINIIIILLWSCKSFPEPSSENDSLLIIPIEVKRETSKSWFGKYVFHIASSDESQVVKTINVPTSSGDIFLTSLEPGDYYIAKSMFIYNDTNKVVSVRECDYIRFSLKAETITVLPWKFVCRFWDKGANTLSMRGGFEPINNQDMREILLKYKDREAFILWKSEVQESMIEEAKKKEAMKLKTVAVIAFQPEGVSKAEAQIVTNLFESKLINTGFFTVIEQEQLEKILDAQADSLVGCTSDDCAIEVGKLLASELIIKGNFSKTDRRYIIEAQLIDVKQQTTIKTASVVTFSLNDITDAVLESLVEKITM